MKRKLKICHVITRMIVGGAQENTLLTVEDHLGKGHDVTLITGLSPGPEGELLRNKKIPEFEMLVCEDLVREINPFRDISAFRWLKGVFLKLKPDVVHTHSSKAGILGRAAAWSAGVPFVCHTVHGQAFHRYEKAWRNMLYKVCERWAARRCHRIFAVADAMVSQCVDAGIADAAKYKTVYSGMELENYLRDDEKGSCELRKVLGIPENSKVVITVARLFPLKGYEYLLPVAELIVGRVGEVYFLVVGDGVMMDGLREASGRAGLNFVFAGLVPPGDIHNYVRIADIMIHLSLREGLPRAVVQGLASGKPVICFALDGAPEVVLDGLTGYAVGAGDVGKVADLAVRLLGDRGKLKELGENGRELVKERFDWRRMGDILEDEYYSGLESADG